MSKIVSKENFLREYFIGTQSPQFVTVNSGAYLLRVNGGSSPLIEYSLNNNIDVCAGRNRISTKLIAGKDNTITLTVEFPLEINKDGFFDVKCSDASGTSILKGEIYKKQKEEDL